MNMHILSEHQFQQVTKALEAASAALAQCQHVELDLSKPKQTISVPAGELKRSSESKTKTHKSKTKTKGKGRRGVQVLTEGKVLEIKRQLAAGGKSVASIARDFGVHVTTINCIKWGKTWKNVQLQQSVALAEGAE